MGFSENRDTSRFSYMRCPGFKETNRMNTWCIQRFGDAEDGASHRKAAVKEVFREPLMKGVYR